MDVKVEISPQFDLGFALADLTSPDPRFTNWPGLKPDAQWLAEARSFGWGFWLGLPDLVENSNVARTTDEFIGRLAAVPQDLILPRIRRSLLHVTESGRSSAQTREWLHYIGLGPTDGTKPDEEWNRPLQSLVGILRSFQESFDPVWARLFPALERSARQVRKLLHQKSISDLAAHLRLAMEFNERSKEMRTVRGGYKWKFSELDTLYLAPSAFNSRRINLVAEFVRPYNVYIPYFLPDVDLPLGLARTSKEEDQIDPWLVCRVVGDPSRADILRLIAAKPRSAAELGNSLGLSKATISHHLFQLRQARIVTERRIGRQVELAVRLDDLRSVGEGLVRELMNPVRKT